MELGVPPAEPCVNRLREDWRGGRFYTGFGLRKPKSAEQPGIHKRVRDPSTDLPSLIVTNPIAREEALRRSGRPVEVPGRNKTTYGGIIESKRGDYRAEKLS